MQHIRQFIKKFSRKHDHTCNFNANFTFSLSSGEGLTLNGPAYVFVVNLGSMSLSATFTLLYINKIEIYNVIILKMVIWMPLGLVYQKILKS